MSSSSSVVPEKNILNDHTPFCDYLLSEEDLALKFEQFRIPFTKG
jgi:hypothetical protein